MNNNKTIITAINNSNGTAEQKAALKIALKVVEDRAERLKYIRGLSPLELKEEIKESVQVKTNKGIIEVRGAQDKPHLTAKDKRIIKYIIEEELYGRSIYTKARPKHFYTITKQENNVLELRIKDWYNNKTSFAFITFKTN